MAAILIYISSYWYGLIGGNFELFQLLYVETVERRPFWAMSAAIETDGMAAISSYIRQLLKKRMELPPFWAMSAAIETVERRPFWALSAAIETDGMASISSYVSCYRDGWNCRHFKLRQLLKRRMEWRLFWAVSAAIEKDKIAANLSYVSCYRDGRNGGHFEF